MLLSRFILFYGLVTVSEWTLASPSPSPSPLTKPRISIAGLFVKPSEREASMFLNSVQQQGALVELGMEFLRENFGEIFDFSHVFLADDQRATSVFLTDDAENFVAKFFYENDQISDGMALISPCAREQMLAGRVSKELHLLHMCSVGNGLIFEDYPQRISVSIYPASAMLQFVNLLFKENKWTSIAAIIDQETYAKESLHRGMHETFVDAFNINNPKFAGIRYYTFWYNGSAGNQEVANTLVKLSEISRIVFVFGSGRSARTVMNTAERLGMTNGEYVFIMMTLQTRDLGSTEQNDTSWIVSKETEKMNIPFQIYPSKSVLLISFVLSYTDESVKKLRQRVLEMAPKDFNFSYPRNKIPTLEYATYEEHLIYGIVLNETYVNTGRLLDGQEMAKHFLNRTFHLPTGELFVNQYGERMCDILGEVLDTKTNSFTTVIRYDHRQDKLIPTRSVNNFWPGEKWPPPNEPFCGFLGNRCKDSNSASRELAGALVGSLVIIFISLCVIAARLWHQSIIMRSSWWKITAEQIGSEVPNISKLSAFLCDIDGGSNAQIRAGRVVQLLNGETAWKSAISQPEKDSKPKITTELLKLLFHVKHMRHSNINHFIGIQMDSVPLYLLEAYCQRGSLDDALEHIKMDMDMALSLLVDLTQGLNYIRGSPLKFHGNLKSSKCLLDTQLGLKISDLPNQRLTNLLNPGIRRRTSSKYLLNAAYDTFFWTAPEVLRGDAPDPKSDVFSFAIITYQILAIRQPYDDLEYSSHEIIQMIRTVQEIPFRPVLNFETDHTGSILAGLRSLIIDCWEENPAGRPTCHQITQVLEKVMHDAGLDQSRSLFDRIMARLSRYAETLEDVVEQRTEQLMIERENCDVILSEMLPRAVIVLLRSGQIVRPECFESVTIFFSDLVGFVDFVERSSPLTVMEFLHIVYSQFDNIVNLFDVYKVETIGDSYMVASGLPKRNGGNHIREICRMALALRKLFPHLLTSPQHAGELCIRVGIHTGPVAAGIVGQKAPRYCLFGDTVNTASRIESHGLPSRIHVSEALATAAESYGFLLEPRGEIWIKGKGDVLTFWLEREIGPTSITYGTVS